MNPQFQGTRSPINGSGMSFFNPQKDVPNPNNPLLYQNTSPNSNYLPNSNSKSFIHRSNILEQPRANNNVSAYIKPERQGVTSGGKFNISNGNIPPPTTFTPSNFGNFNPANFQTKTSGSQMIKSLIHDPPKTNQSSISFNSNIERLGYNNTTPTRRAPRLSEPLIENPTTKPFEFKANSFTNQTEVTNTESPNTLTKKFKDPKQFENNFFKNKHSAQDTNQTKTEPTAPKFLTEKTQWQKASLGKKKYNFTPNDFDKIKQLGSGKYGQVFLVRQKKTGFICALKLLEKKLLLEEEITEQFIRELKIQMYLNHPNIIKLYGFFDDEHYIYIILEVGTGGQLYHQLRKSEPMPENKVATIMKQVCQAVNQIHSLRIIHRDIKPENIVIHDNVIKLCDFGWSVYLDNKLRTTFCGTPLYVCPQILRGKQYDQKIDIWSLGIMMYEMLVGQNPFKITKEEQLIKIVKDEISIPSYVFVSRQGRDFLDKCLKKNPADRVTIKQLLNHEFFIKNAEKDKKISM